MRIDLDALDAMEKRATPGEWDFWIDRFNLKGGPGQIGSVVALDGVDSSPWYVATIENAPEHEANAALIAALRNAAPALIRVAKAAREWRAAYLADGDDEEPPFITKLDIAAGELCDAVRALKGEG